MRYSRAGGIKKTTLMGEIFNQYPEVAEVLIEEYGLHCVGCGMAGYESLEDGLAVHGFDKKEIEKIIKKLNQLIKKTHPAE